MFGSPDFTAVLVLVGLFVAVLLALLSYHTPRRDYVNTGLGILILATSLALILGAFGTPSVATALVLLIVFVTIIALLLTYQSPAWATPCGGSGWRSFFWPCPCWPSAGATWPCSL